MVAQHFQGWAVSRHNEHSMAGLMSSFYLNNYQPLAASPSGREAVNAFQLPPFIDGSIRREPDLEHDYPAITCLCRGGKFAPRLEIGDIVAYVTKKRSFGLGGRAQRRLTAVLRVAHRFESHTQAKLWYDERGMSLPSNLMVPGNAAAPFEQSHRLCRSSKCLGAAKTFREWDASYRARARKFPVVVGCVALKTWLGWDAPEVTDADLESVFGAVPGMQNPGEHSLREFQALMRRLGLSVPLSAR